MADETWAFVDDQTSEAQSFADSLGEGDLGILVKPLTPAEAREQLLTNRWAPAGVLMDVQLSAVHGELGTGPGIAQDLRSKQRAKDVQEFPIVRFAWPQPVAKYVGGDPASEDLFDLEIGKEELLQSLLRVQSQLRGVREVYDALLGKPILETSAIGELLGLTPAELETWSDSSLHNRLAANRQIAPHVAAQILMRGLLLSTGLLIEEPILAFRLGVDRESSGQAWLDLKQKLSAIKYKGIAHASFERWWARGLEEWWLDLDGGASSLPALTISERVGKLRKRLELDLMPLAMPRGSAGDKPWRACALTLEASPSAWVPVDPSAGVRLTPRVELPPWIDPQYATLGQAMRARNEDLRINCADLDRIAKKFQ